MKLPFKGFIVAMVLVFAFLSLVGCGGGKKEVADQPTTGQAKEESIAELLAKGKQVQGMSFDYTFTQDNMTRNGKMWVQDKKVKTESTVEGKKVIKIFDGEETVYNYNPSEKYAIKFSVKDFQQNMVTTPYDYTENIDMNTVTLVERTIYNGVKCKVFMVKQKDIYTNIGVEPTKRKNRTLRHYLVVKKPIFLR